MAFQDPRQHRKHYLLPVVSLLYLLLLAYGSLYPFSGWQWPTGELEQLVESQTRWVPRSDFLTNFLVYLPVGILLVANLKGMYRGVALVLAATLFGGFLSLSLETLQLFLPKRVSSIVDVWMNLAGTLSGATAGFIFSAHTRWGRRLRDFRYHAFNPGRFADLGLVLLALWCLAELSPLAPATKVSIISDQISAFAVSFRNLDINSLILLSIAAQTAVLGILVNGIIRRARLLWPWLGAIVAAVLILKIPVEARQLTPEHVLGSAVGLATAALILERLSAWRNHAAIALLLFAFLSMQLHAPVAESLLSEMNWRLFGGQIGKVQRFAEILEISWMFLGLAYFTLATKPRHVEYVGVAGGILVLLICLGVELAQRYMPGASADITDVSLALVAWTLPWLHPVIRKGPLR